MKKEEFNKLELMDQVDYINNNLKNNTLTKICEEIGISRSTIRDRFSKAGYSFDKTEIKYIYSEIKNKSFNVQKHNNNTNALEDKIKCLELKIEAIEGVLNVGSKYKELSVRNFKGETVSRCYRLYEEVQQEFSSFCKQNSSYKVQDLLSEALVEYMENHKTE